MVKFIDRPPDRKAMLVVKPSVGKSVDRLRRRIVPPRGENRVEGTARIPNASLIYGIAAAVLLALGLYTVVISGQWFTGLLIMILGGLLLGYALHFMKAQ